MFFTLRHMTSRSGLASRQSVVRFTPDAIHLRNTLRGPPCAGRPLSRGRELVSDPPGWSVTGQIDTPEIISPMVLASTFMCGVERDYQEWVA
jgi:hypothetical protein